jgi:uncharacterized coiled-coil DUF342 family protein
MAFETVGVRAVIEGVSSFERGTRRMKDGLEDVGKSAMTAEKRTQILSKGLTKLGLAFVATAAAGGALLLSSVKLAARVETLGVVTTTLGKNVGKTEDEIRSLEKAVQNQGITMRGSRKAIALMIQSQIDLSHATKLAAMAQDAAVIAGINSTEAFERLVFVITSGNVRMARTLGLQISFQSAYKKTAEQLGKTTSELTDLEKVQARTNVVLSKATTIAGAYDAAMETAGKKVTSLDRHIEDSKVMLGEIWLPVYANVIDFVTKSLVAWQDLSDAQKAVESKMLGIRIAFFGIVGVIALLIPKIIAAKAAYLALATAVAGSGTIVFGAATVLGIYIAAILAVIIAIDKLIKFFAMIKAGTDAVNAAVDEHVEHMIKAAGSYEEYRAELERVGKVSKKIVGTQKELDELAKEGFVSQSKLNDAIVVITESQFEYARATKGTGEELAGYYDHLLKTDQQLGAVVETTAQAAKKQELLRTALDKLNLTISTDIGKQFTDFKTKVDDLNIKIDELEGQTYLTSAQKKQLEDYRGELDEVTSAWDRQTAQVIFNLAQQRLAIDGFTREEIAALTRLAGPEGLGLVDAAGAALIEKIDLLALSMDEAGDQSDIFADDMVALQAMMLDPTVSADELADAINRIRSKSVTVKTTYITRRKTITEYRTIVGTGPQRYQHGGFAPGGRAAMVGEVGREMFVPRQSGTILNNRFVNAISTLTAAMKSAPMLSAPSVAASSSIMRSQSNEYNLNINTRAPIEPIVSDFRAMESMAGAY